jgi:hypothetical protein
MGLLHASNRTDLPLRLPARTPEDIFASRVKGITPEKVGNDFLTSMNLIFNVCHPEVFNTHINVQCCIGQTQQNFIVFIIVLGQHVSILIESTSGPLRYRYLLISLIMHFKHR